MSNEVNGSMEDDEEEEVVIILEDDFTKDVKEEELIGYAQFLGFDVEKDQEFLPIALEALKKPLPVGWKRAFLKNSNRMCYYDMDEQNFHLYSPNDEKAIEEYNQAKKEKKNTIKPVNKKVPPLNKGNDHKRKKGKHGSLINSNNNQVVKPIKEEEDEGSRFDSGNKLNNKKEGTINNNNNNLGFNYANKNEESNKNEDIYNNNVNIEKYDENLTGKNQFNVSKFNDNENSHKDIIINPFVEGDYENYEKIRKNQEKTEKRKYYVDSLKKLKQMQDSVIATYEAECRNFEKSKKNLNIEYENQNNLKLEHELKYLEKRLKEEVENYEKIEEKNFINEKASLNNVDQELQMEKKVLELDENIKFLVSERKKEESKIDDIIAKNNLINTIEVPTNVCEEGLKLLEEKHEIILKNLKKKHESLFRIIEKEEELKHQEEIKQIQEIFNSRHEYEEAIFMKSWGSVLEDYKNSLEEEYINETKVIEAENDEKISKLIEEFKTSLEEEQNERIELLNRQMKEIEFSQLRNTSREYKHNNDSNKLMDDHFNLSIRYYNEMMNQMDKKIEEFVKNIELKIQELKNQGSVNFYEIIDFLSHFKDEFITSFQKSKNHYDLTEFEYKDKSLLFDYFVEVGMSLIKILRDQDSNIKNLDKANLGLYINNTIKDIQRKFKELNSNLKKKKLFFNESKVKTFENFKFIGLNSNTFTNKPYLLSESFLLPNSSERFNFSKNNFQDLGYNQKPDFGETNKHSNLINPEISKNNEINIDQIYLDENQVEKKNNSLIINDKFKNETIKNIRDYTTQNNLDLNDEQRNEISNIKSFLKIEKKNLSIIKENLINEIKLNDEYKSAVIRSSQNKNIFGKNQRKGSEEIEKFTNYIKSFDENDLKINSQKEIIKIRSENLDRIDELFQELNINLFKPSQTNEFDDKIHSLRNQIQEYKANFSAERFY